MVRSLVLQAIAPADDLKSALDRLETDHAAIDLGPDVYDTWGVTVRRYGA